MVEDRSIPMPGQVVHVRSRRYLVQQVESPQESQGDATVHLAYIEDAFTLLLTTTDLTLRVPDT